jgi:DNA adenine methylase
MTKTLISPLRYPGSKRRLGSFVINSLKINSIKPEFYIEPFSGGASVALQLMHENLADKILLMDIDPWISSFWDVLFFDTEWLIDQIMNIPITLQMWHKLKNGNPKDKRNQAITGFFLNRTSFSGILEKAVGPLGGKKQESKYKIDCRFPRETLAKRIREISVHRNRVYGVWNCSWEEGVSRLRKEQSLKKIPNNNLFFYFDPPFFEKADKLYRYYFRQPDHLKFRDFVINLTDNWLLSYDSAPQLEVLYGEALKNGTNGAKKQGIELVYSTGNIPKRKPTSEFIISNLKHLPEHT